MRDWLNSKIKGWLNSARSGLDELDNQILKFRQLKESYSRDADSSSNNWSSSTH